MKKFTLFLSAMLLACVTSLFADDYVKVTSEPTDWSGEYLLVYENSATEAYVWTGVDANNCYTPATISNNTITGESFVTITIAPMTGGYSVLVNGSANNGQYISGGKKNALNYGATASLNTITFNSGNVAMKSQSGTMQFYKNSSQGNRFRYYTSNQSAVQLYKKAPAGTLQSIAVSGTPNKTEYFAGEKFDPAGLVVTGTYSDNSIKTITEGITWDCDPEILALETTSVYVIASVKGADDAEVVGDIEVPVTVTAPKTLASLAISGEATKMTYYVGDAFDIAGLMVTATYTDGTTAEVTDNVEWTITPATFETQGITDVTVKASLNGIESAEKTIEYIIVQNRPQNKVVTFVAGTDVSNELSLTKEGVTLTLTSGTLSGTDNYRTYASATITVSATGEISSIVFTCTAKGTNKYGPGKYSTTIGNYIYETDGNTGTWTGTETEVAFTASAQVRMTKIEVTYAPSSATAIDDIIAPAEKVVKTIENGQLVIIREGVKYNAQGVVIR